jgi:hypothetical protein
MIVEKYMFIPRTFVDAWQVSTERKAQKAERKSVYQAHGCLSADQRAEDVVLKTSIKQIRRKHKEQKRAWLAICDTSLTWN